MSASETKVAEAVNLGKLKLAPPEAVEEVSALQVAGSGPIAADSAKLNAKVAEQVERFAKTLLEGDVGSEEFRAKVDQAFSLGRAEIAKATELSNRFTRQSLNAPGGEAAHKALGDMRALFDELRPPGTEELLSPTRIFGIPVPFGDKLARYMDKFASADKRMGALRDKLETTKDETLKDVAELGEARRQIWAALGKLDGAASFLEALDRRLENEAASFKATDPAKARAIEQEVLFYARQNLEDVRASQALSVNAYNVLEVLQKTGRETVNGCDRVLTVGMTALSVAATLARATGNQMAAQKAISGSKEAIEGLIAQTGKALGDHVAATAKFAQDPVLGVKTLSEMIDQTFGAMDVMDDYRSKSLEAMKANDAMLKKQIEGALARINARSGKTPGSGPIEIESL